ncbi:MAG: RNA 2'-phosphotransferase [Deltaproteobacteria bacterium]|nr:RNA 2'-phosphotransferase [Deltaproteobacteria bacterium]
MNKSAARVVGRARNAMNDRDLKKKSTRLSWLLRHGALESKLAMDSAGFADVDDVLRLTGLTRAALDGVVEENNKSRFEITGARIRAVQGHSLEGTPVTLEGLEQSWDVVVDDAPLFHGTSVAAAHAILESEGLHSAARTHVHLAGSADAKVGKRAGVDVVLVVDVLRLRAAGLPIFRAPNGVLLARRVPRSAVIDVQAQSRAGETALAQLLARLQNHA